MYKLTYFNVTALGEPIRMLFNYGGIAFEDDRFEIEQWPEIKPSTPFGQVPVLTIDGKKINQSLAIARYVAKLVKLAGKDDFHTLEIDSMVDNINEVRASNYQYLLVTNAYNILMYLSLEIADYWYQTDEKIKEAKKEPLMKEILPNLLPKLEAVAKENNGYFVHAEVCQVAFVF